MKLSILQTGHAPNDLAQHHGDYDNMFRDFLADQTFSFETFQVDNGVFPKAVDAAAGWLITGSRHGVDEGHEWISQLEGFIRECITAERPILGVCFGHQVMAKAFGGQVRKFDEGWTLGRERYGFRWREDLWLIAWHREQVAFPPTAATVIARSDRCEYAALLYGHYGFSLQPHPEFDASFARDMLLTSRPADVPDDVRRRALESLNGPLSHNRSAELIKGFFEQRKGYSWP